MIKKQDISIEKNHYGAWVVSAIVNGYLTTRQFYGYTKRDAISRFIAHANTKTN